MSRAYADPEELMEFAGVLEHYISTLDDETGRLNSAFGKLEETWQDQQRSSFEERYRELLNVLNSFKESASQQIPHLRTMAEDLRTYLNR